MKKEQTYKQEDFYKNLEHIFREKTTPTQLAGGMEFFVSIHFIEFNIDFLREFKNRIDWNNVYQYFRKNGEVWKLKENEKVFKEFFGDINEY